MRLPYFAVAAAVLSCSLAAHADLIGNTVNVSYLYPDTSTTLFDLGTFTVPASGGITFVGGFTITGTQITVTSAVSQDFPASAYNGFQFLVTGTDPMISGVSLDSASTFTPADISYTSNSVLVNFSGLHADAGQQAILDLSFGQIQPPPVVGATPEPSSFALLGTGLLGAAGMMRRRFARS